MQNVTCARTSWPNEPRAPKNWKKKTSRLRPMMISGVTMGSSRSVSAAARPRNLTRASASPSSVPSAVDTITTTTARRSVTPTASSSRRFAKSVGYQSRVKPSHWKLSFEVLKENTIRTTIGAKRNR
jgi:hypothetical protein